MPKKPKSILVVEDEKSLNKIITLKLEEAGYRVESVFDGEEAIGALAKKKPDLVWLDIYLPKIDGFGVLDWIRKNLETKNLPIFIVSVSGSNKKIEQAQRFGVLEYCVKSNYKIGELVEKVDVFLMRRA